MKAPEGKWLVHHGIHRRTLTSRDSGPATEHDSKQDAIDAFKAAKASYARSGYVTWFAYMYDDQGNKTVLDTPEAYR